MMKAKFFNFLEFLFQIILTIVGTFLLASIIFAKFNYQWDQSQYSFVYSIIVFLIGIHIALKIRILDSKEEYYPLIKKLYFGKELFIKNELIAFIFSIVINITFLITITAWIAQDSDNKVLSDSINVIICLDFVAICRNLRVLIRLYWKTVFPSNKKPEGPKERDCSMDLFEAWLNQKEKSKWVNIALTDNSYKNKYSRENSVKYVGEVNKDLATYGDAIIKICYIEILYGNTDKLSVEKSEYESDKYLVEKVAQHYNLLEYMNYDDKDPKNVKDYNYIVPPNTRGGNRSDSSHKYIATAVEAMIGAIYKSTKDLDAITQLLKEWMSFK